MINEWKALRERLIKRKKKYADYETDRESVMWGRILEVLQDVLDDMEELERKSLLQDVSHESIHARCPVCGIAFTLTF